MIRHRGAIGEIFQSSLVSFAMGDIWWCKATCKEEVMQLYYRNVDLLLKFHPNYDIQNDLDAPILVLQ